MHICIYIQPQKFQGYPYPITNVLKISDMTLLVSLSIFES
jgi:hypothetical protein